LQIHITQAAISLHTADPQQNVSGGDHGGRQQSLSGFVGAYSRALAGASLRKPGRRHGSHDANQKKVSDSVLVVSDGNVIELASGQTPPTD
jgi:hypothetical protein